MAELPLTLSGWPAGTRAICRRERPHPGAQLSFTDENGYRFQVFLTNQQGKRIARLEQLHRARAACEDRIRCGKQTGLRNLPFRSFQANSAWLELVLLGQDLLVWTQRLLLAGTELARCEPKRLRYRLLHVAGREPAPAPAERGSTRGSTTRACATFATRLTCLPKPFWPRQAGANGRCRARTCDLLRVKSAGTVADGCGWPPHAGFRPGRRPLGCPRFRPPVDRVFTSAARRGQTTIRGTGSRALPGAAAPRRGQ